MSNPYLEPIEPIGPAKMSEPTILVEEKWEVTHSPTIGKLVESLCKAQLKFKPVLKTVDNAAFMRGGKASKYADLAEYIDATQEALATEGLVVLQWPDVSPEAKSMRLTSILAHSSGEWMRGTLTLPAIGRDGFTAQSCGSSITYARRYSYAAITGCASEDDDGNAASGRGTHEAAQAVAEEKIAKLKKSNAGTKDYVPSLFYTRLQSGMYEISGDKALMGLHKDLLRKFWDNNAKVVVVTDNDLEDLKYMLNERQCPLSALQAAQ